MTHSFLKSIIARFIDLEHNPKTQYTFHRYAMYFWILNFFIGSAVVIFASDFWIRIGLYYVFAVSIYANLDTDFDAMSASIAAMRSEEIIKKLDEQDKPSLE